MNNYKSNVIISDHNFAGCRVYYRYNNRKPEYVYTNTDLPAGESFVGYAIMGAIYIAFYCAFMVCLFYGTSKCIDDYDMLKFLPIIILVSILITAFYAIVFYSTVVKYYFLWKKYSNYKEVSPQHTELFCPACGGVYIKGIERKCPYCGDTIESGNYSHDL